MRRPSRVLSAVLSALLVVSGVALSSVVAAAPAQAAPGDPFSASDPQVFVAQGDPAQLFRAVTNSSGAVSFQPEGSPVNLRYNAMSYNTADNYLYAITGSAGGSIPANALIRIGQGGVITRVGSATYTSATSLNAGTFGPNGYLYINSSGATPMLVINVSTGALVQTVTLSAVTGAADLTYANGFFWGLTGNGGTSSGVVRVNPTTGVVSSFPSPVPLANADAGAAWTFGNGNLGFSSNTTGVVSQLAVTNPASATPTFRLVSQNAGPASGQNDGAASPGQPTDLSITKSGPAVLTQGATVTYTLTVTNNGPGNSSGFSVADDVPSTLTGVASPTSGCAVSGNTVSCVGGRILVGQSVQYTITANVPAGLNTAVTNTATVTANESDPNLANNTSSTTGGPASVSLVKHAAAPVDANGDGITDAGDTIQYTFTVTNTGLLALNNLAVTDAKAGAVNCPVAPLAPGASVTCAAAAPYTITAADVSAGGVDNSATASGIPQGGTAPVVSAPSTTHTPTTAPAPAIAIVKSATPSSAAAFQAGQVVTYTFAVTNTGNVPLTGVAIDDSDFSGSGTLSALTCPAGADTLAAGEQVSCTATYTVTQADVDAGSVNNSAFATGIPPGAIVPIQSPPSQVTIPVDAAPAISLVKSANPATANAAGDTITYSFRVTNTGNVTVANPSITETAFSGSGTAPVAICPTGPLQPGQFLSCTATYTLTQADVDAGSVTNTATAAATPPTGPAVVSGPSSAAVSIAPAAALTIVKTATPTTADAAGDAISYSFLVTNTGNVTLANVGVNEGAFSGTGTLSPAVCPAGAASLAPNASVTCTAAYTFTQADVDAGKVTNTATATGTPPGGGNPIVSLPSTATVLANATPAISLVKSATPATIDAAGDLVSYSFLVTNTGNVTLTDPAITETAFSGTGAVPAAVCPTGPIAPNASVTCTANYTATQADVDAGTITNTATATGTPPGGGNPIVSLPSSASVTAAAAPSLSLFKTSDTTTITTLGQVVNYAFLVTNTGNVTMNAIAIAEGTFSGTGTLPAAVCPQPSLAPGANETCTTDYTVTQADLDAGGTLSNTATATGTPPGSNVPVSSLPSRVDIPVTQTASLGLVKSASTISPDGFKVGEDIAYTFVVTNTGNVTITDVVIQEGTFTGSGTLPAADCPSGPLAPGDQLVCTTHYTATQADVDASTLTNTATATGTPPANVAPPVSPPSTVTLPSPPAPAVTMVKTADVQTITRAGQKITYTFTVTNTGNVTLTKPTITEGTFSGHGTLSAPECPALTSGLAPGQVLVCLATYTVVAADLTGAPVTNTATVSVTTPGGDPLTSDPSTATVKVNPPAVAASPLPDTGSTIGWGIGSLAAALLAAGGALMFFRRRRISDN